MSNNTLSYPQVCKDKREKYYIDFNLNNKRYRLFGGKMIGSSLLINSYPKHLRRKQASVLSEQVYKHLVANDYSFSKKLNQVETFDLLISDKLKEPLSVSYKKALTHLGINLREQLLSKGNISKQFLNSFPLRYENNTSYNTTRRHLNVLVNHLYNNDYFQTLFSRFNQLNPKINKGITLYSFRHSAALNIFKRTGSLTKLQKAMGHSSLKVSLTYLRGLEVAELTEEDMPML